MSAYHNPKGLPQSLHSQFKSIFKLYEQKQYKRSLKAAEQILRDYPNHGETLAMKGLTLHSTNKKKEAYLCARKALANDSQSHVCWHVLGILYRGDRHYLDAAKCYENALVHQKDSQQIMRDLAQLHIQNRNYEANMKLRNKILKEKSNQKQNWFGFAVACHLAGDLEKAINVIDAFDAVEKEKEKDEKKEHEAEEKYERSEVLLYKNLILEETGDYPRALKHLEEVENELVDREEVTQRKADYYFALGKFEDSARMYRSLVKGNPENWNFHSGLLVALKIIPKQASLWSYHELTPEKTKEVTCLYDELRSLFPRASAVKLIPMSFISGEDFQTRFKKFLETQLSKAVPSVFNVIKHLYKHPNKATLISAALTEMENSLKNAGKFSPEQDLLEPPSTILCLNTFLAQHYCLIGQHDKALQYVEICQKHTPTVLDFEILKATIYKYAGNPVLAAKHMDEAQSMDLADRYLNTKATRYFLRADQITKAQETISLFTKPDAESGSSAYSTIFDMQVMWYEYDEGCSWLRQKEYGKALKKFVDTEKHFLDIISDQLDFHSYCLRKQTLKQYVKMLRLEDKIYGHQYYVRAALEIVKTYLYLHDHPSERTKVEEDAFVASLAPEEQKKYLRKKKKEEAKKIKQEEEKKQQQQQRQQKKGKVAPADDDPNGDRLLKVSDKLEEAHKYLKNLVLFAEDNIEAHLLSFEVAIRRKKFLVALKAVNKGRKLAPLHPGVHLITVKFLLNAAQVTNPLVKQVIDEEQVSILNGQTLANFNSAFLQSNSKSLSARHAFTVCAILLDPSKKEEYLRNLCADLSDVGFFPLKECIEIHKYLLQESATPALSYFEKCKERFPMATYFSPPKNEEEEESEKLADSKEAQH